MSRPFRAARSRGASLGRPGLRHRLFAHALLEQGAPFTLAPQAISRRSTFLLDHIPIRDGWRVLGGRLPKQGRTPHAGLFARPRGWPLSVRIPPSRRAAAPAPNRACPDRIPSRNDLSPDRTIRKEPR